MSILNKLLFCAGLLGVLDTVFVLAISGGVNVGTLLPGVVGLFLVSLAWFCPGQGINVVALWQWNVKSFLLLVFCGGLLSFVIVQALILSCHFNRHECESDWCILLGAGLRGDRPTLTLRCRIDVAASYLAKHPDTRVVVSGGMGASESVPEAEVMKRGLVEAGVEPARIHLESKATSTLENLRYSREVIEQTGGKAADTVSVISSDFHLFRVRLLASRLGMNVCPISAPTPWYLLPNVCIREYFALIKSFMLDR